MSDKKEVVSDIWLLKTVSVVRTKLAFPHRVTKEEAFKALSSEDYEWDDFEMYDQEVESYDTLVSGESYD